MEPQGVWSQRSGKEEDGTVGKEFGGAQALSEQFAMTLSKCWRQSTRRQASIDSTSDAGVTNQSNDIFWRVGDRALTVVLHIYLRERSVPLFWLAPGLSSLSLPYPGPFIYTFICMHHNSLPKSGQLK